MMGKAFGIRGLAAAGLMALMIAPSAVPAQFSDSYSFLKAVRDRDSAKVNTIIGKGSTTLLDTKDVATGESAVHIVTKRRDAVWLNFLLSSGASPDTRDNAGNTALLFASQIGFDDGARLLLGARAGVDVANRSGETPLIKAVQAGNSVMVRLLIAAGANPKKTDSVAGLSARDYAARNPRLASILKLLDEAKPVAPAKPVAGPKF